MAEGGGPVHREGQHPLPQQVIQQQQLHMSWSQKVQRFCLTLVGEARNWYATLEPLAMTWPELQNMFRW